MAIDHEITCGVIYLSAEMLKKAKEEINYWLLVYYSNRFLIFHLFLLLKSNGVAIYSQHQVLGQIL